MESVKSVCENALWLSHGKVMAAGPVDEVAEKYVQFLDEGNR
jgi:ABC-type polysaccharide/polyol phosphate transport system ATPase subunit